MKILITGANGFIGRNVVETLRATTTHTLMLVDKDTLPETLAAFIKDAEFILHFAGVNRPQLLEEFQTGNVDFTETLLAQCQQQRRPIPVVFASSIQAEQDNPYALSKREAEARLRAYATQTGSKVYIYRFPNVFGKWSRPNYNSAVATFCHNIARNLPITVHDPSVVLTLVYVDDVVLEIMRAIHHQATPDGAFYRVPIAYERRLDEIVGLITSFKDSRHTRIVPDMADPFTKKLYSTYTSFIPLEGLNYDLVKHEDARGSFTEFVKSMSGGQVSVNISKPGVTKGDHWHHTKNEKFFVVQGEGIIRFRPVGSDDITMYSVSGTHHQVIEIPVGSTHNIENCGTTDLITLMWVNEPFDPDHPDTIPLEV